MPAKIRLQRKGKKGQPFYHIVIADGRAPREGRFIERIGTYNPLTQPAEIDLNFDKAIDWMQKGAQPTETVKAILSYKGVLYKFHLLTGVKKGAMTPEQAEAKFQTWLQEKQEKIVSKIKQNALNIKEARKEMEVQEAKVNEAKAASIAKKLAKAAAAEVEAREVAVHEAEAKVQAEAAARQPEHGRPEEPVVAETHETPETPAVPEAPETPAEEPKQE